MRVVLMQRWILIHALSRAVTSWSGVGVGLAPHWLAIVASRSFFVHSPRSYALLRRHLSRTRISAPSGGALYDRGVLFQVGQSSFAFQGFTFSLGFSLASCVGESSLAGFPVPPALLGAAGFVHTFGLS